MMDVAWNVTATVGQLTYISRTVLSTGHGSVFPLLCLARPALEAVFDRSLWSKPHVVEANDPHYLRMKGLRELSEPKYRQDIITGDIVQHILQGTLYCVFLAPTYTRPEFRRAVRLLGDADISQPYEQYRRLNGAASHIVTKLARDLPMVRWPPFL
jgi:hypothetical protein